MIAFVEAHEATGLVQSGVLASAAGMREVPSVLAKKVVNIKKLLRRHMSFEASLRGLP